MSRFERKRKIKENFTFENKAWWLKRIFSMTSKKLFLRLEKHRIKMTQELCVQRRVFFWKSWIHSHKDPASRDGLHGVTRFGKVRKGMVPKSHSGLGNLHTTHPIDQNPKFVSPRYGISHKHLSSDGMSVSGRSRILVRGASGVLTPMPFLVSPYCIRQNVLKIEVLLWLKPEKILEAGGPVALVGGTARSGPTFCSRV